MADKITETKQIDEKWFESKRECEVSTDEKILKRITLEKKKFERYNSGLFLWFLRVLLLTFIPRLWISLQARNEKSEKI